MNDAQIRHISRSDVEQMSTSHLDRVSVPIPSELSEVVASQFGDRLPLIQEYVSLLENEGIEWGLIGPRETDRLWERHIVNSLCVSSLIAKGLFVTDCGSGAGLPGIVLAIARPDLYIDLVEPMSRRCDFLSMCVSELGLSSTVNVVRSRVEDYRMTPDILTCRALSGLSTLIAMTSHLVPPSTLLAIKGARAETELMAAKSLLISRHLQADIIRPEVKLSSTSNPILLGTVVRVTKAQTAVSS